MRTYIFLLSALVAVVVALPTSNNLKRLRRSMDDMGEDDWRFLAEEVLKICETHDDLKDLDISDEDCIMGALKCIFEWEIDLSSSDSVDQCVDKHAEAENLDKKKRIFPAVNKRKDDLPFDVNAALHVCKTHNDLQHLRLSYQDCVEGAMDCILWKIDLSSPESMDKCVEAHAKAGNLDKKKRTFSSFKKREDDLPFDVEAAINVCETHEDLEHLELTEDDCIWGAMECIKWGIDLSSAESMDECVEKHADEGNLRRRKRIFSRFNRKTSERRR